MASVCRLCLNLCSDYYRDMKLMDWRQFQLVLPEIDLDVIGSPLICFKCIELLRAAYSFKMNCLETEKLIKSYAKKHNQKHFNVDEVLKEQFISRDDKSSVVPTTDLEGGNINVIPIETKIKFEVKSTNLFDDLKRFDAGTCSINDKNINNSMDIIKKEVVSDMSEEDMRNVTNEGCKTEMKEQSSDDDMIRSKDYNTSRMDVHHEDNNPIKCEICRNVFIDIFEVIEHVNSHFRNVKCLACGELFINLKNIRQHFVEHHRDLLNTNLDDIEDLLRVIYKEECPSTSKDQSENNSITCYTCSNLISKNSYIKHMAAHLIKNKHFNYENYLRKRHDIYCPIYPCEICGFITRRKASFAKHMASHTIKKSYKCEKCGKVFSRIAHLITHRRNAHNFRFICEYCDQPVRSKRALSLHLANAHKPEELQYRHGCPLCPKLFCLPWELAPHMKKEHKNQKIFQCSYCSKQFYLESAREQHMQQKHEYW